MRYRIVAVGKLRERFYRDACSHYLDRLTPFAPCELFEVKEGRGGGPAEVREAEGRALMAQAQGVTVALDEKGRTFSTAALARHVTELELRGESSLTLLIGGAEGHPESLRERVDDAWSLSPLTLPHDLARLVLLEQLYRIETLRAGHPYHRG